MRILFTIILVVLALAANAQRPIKVYSKDGITIKSYDFNGFENFLRTENDTTYVINFWATWCKPCIEEMPNFEKLNRLYQSQKVKVILVSLDMAKQVETNLIPFIHRKKIHSKAVHLSDPDANSWISKVNQEWSGAIPATIIYNKDFRKFFERSFTYEELEKEVKPLIR